MVEPQANSVPIISQSRIPRAQLKINGTIVDWEMFEVDNNANFQPDVFRVDIPISSLPKSLSINKLVSDPILLVELLAGFPNLPNATSSASLQSLILGQVDDLTFEAGPQTLTLSGRDLTARFIDTKTTQKYINQTSSDIATMLAGFEGLTPVVTSTSAKVGLYYQIDNAKIASLQTLWDLLTYLARQEGFICYVAGTKLYFGPQTTNATPFLIQYSQGQPGVSLSSSNILDIKFSHNKTLARDVKVTVNSWSQATASPITATVTATHVRSPVLSGASPKTGTPQEYIYRFPNLTKDQATAKAKQLAAEITAHEMVLTAHMPADNRVGINVPIQVKGTGTPFDQTYYPSSIIRRMSIAEGYIMEITAKNHSPETQVGV